MPFKPVLTKYRKSAEVLSTYDFFESILGTAFIKFFLLGTKDSAGLKYHLTTDSSIGSHGENLRIVDGGINIDFDIPVELPFKILARDAIISMSSERISGADKTLTYTVFHVTSGGTETSLGSVITEDIALNKRGRRAMKISMTEKRFKKGEKLRLNVTASAAMTAWWDPVGRLSIVEQIGGNATTNSQAVLLLPIEVPR